MGERITRRVVGGSVRLYRLLLWLYPSDFRRAFGAQMAQTFRDCCCDATRAGLWSLILFWARALADVMASTSGEWMAQLRQASPRRSLAYERSAPMRPIEQPHRLVLSLDNFTKRARHVFQLAGEEAHALGHPQVSIEHLLLGLIAEQNGVSGAVFREFGITLEHMRPLLRSGDRTSQAAPQPHPVSAQVVQVAQYAVEEAKALNHAFVGTEHLLLALVRLGQGAGVSAIEASGVSLEQIHAATLKILEKRKL